MHRAAKRGAWVAGFPTITFRQMPRGLALIRVNKLSTDTLRDAAKTALRMGCGFHKAMLRLATARHDQLIGTRAYVMPTMKLAVCAACEKNPSDEPGAMLINPSSKHSAV